MTKQRPRHALLNIAKHCLFRLLVFIGVVWASSVHGTEVTTSTWQEPVFGGKVYIRQAGINNQSLLLLVHGLGDEAGQIWADLIPKLATAYHVVVPDLPGFGHSSKDNQLYSPENYARLLDWILGHFPNKPIYLVGHSLGGAVSLYYAAQDPKALKRLILVDSVGFLHRLAISQTFVRKHLLLKTPFSQEVNSALGKMASLFLEKASRIPWDPKTILLDPDLRGKLLRAPAQIAALALVETDFSLLIDKVLCPTWLLWGEEDETAPRRIANILLWRLPAAELRLLPGMGHSPMRDDSTEFLTALQKCLTELPTPAKKTNPKGRLSDKTVLNQQNATITGSYNTLGIRNCQNLKLRNVWAHQIEILDSQIRMEGITVVAPAGKTGISVTRSTIVLTGADITGSVGIRTNQSRLDLAGLRYHGDGSPILGTGKPSSLLLSTATAYTHGQTRSLQGDRGLRSGESI